MAKNPAYNGWSWDRQNTRLELYVRGTKLAHFKNAADKTLQRSATAVVAASDASAQSILGADYFCDGIADEEQIQLAIDALPTGGGKVRLTEGTFNLASRSTHTTGGATTMTFADVCILIDHSDGDIVLEGQGDATVLKLTADQAANTVHILAAGLGAGSRTGKTYIEKIAFDGNLTNQENTWTDFGMVEVAYADDAVVRDCYFKDAPFMACQFYRNSRRFWFLTNRIVMPTGAIGAALRLESKDAWVLGNYMEGVAADARTLIDLAPNHDILTFPEHITVGWNILGEAGCHIALNGAQRCRVIGNDCYDQKHNSLTSIWLLTQDTGSYDCADNTVSKNTIYNARKGIRLTGTTGENCVRNIITENEIIDGPDMTLVVGIEEVAPGTVDYNVIKNNPIQGATTAIIRIGPNTIVRDNPGGVASGDLVTIFKVIDHAALTDGGGATGYMDFTETIPAGSIIKSIKCDFTEAFSATGTSTLTMMIGPQADLDAYNLTADPGEDAYNHTTDVFWGESDCQAHIVTAAAAPRVTFTEDSDITTTISAGDAQGAVTVTITYMKA